MWRPDDLFCVNVSCCSCTTGGAGENTAVSWWHYRAVVRVRGQSAEKLHHLSEMLRCKELGDVPEGKQVFNYYIMLH